MKLIRAFLFALAALCCFPQHLTAQQSLSSTSRTPQYRVPQHGKISVAFVLTDQAVTIDFAGPWEVFKDTFLPERGKTMAEQSVFSLYTVSDTKQPVTTSGGMKIVPDYTFDDAPPPAIVVIPAQRGRSPAMMNWIRRMTLQSDVVMSVCTGADVLADAGLLNGKPATTHHLFYDEFHGRFPKVELVKDRRFVQSDPILFTAGGLSSGIDLALHIVQLYAGEDVAEKTAKLMEYEGTGWKDDAKISPPK
jgi:transcriptional regulator GlxA family with amidase domain